MGSSGTFYTGSSSYYGKCVAKALSLTLLETRELHVNENVDIAI